MKDIENEIRNKRMPNFLEDKSYKKIIPYI